MTVSCWRGPEGKVARKRNPKNERRRENKSSEGRYPSKEYRIEKEKKKIKKGQQEKKKKKKGKHAIMGEIEPPIIANKGRERLN